MIQEPSKLTGECNIYIVYLTSGEYSSFTVDGILVCKVDPKPILDDVARRHGWSDYESFDKGDIGPFRNEPRRGTTVLAVRREVRKKMYDALIAAGFEKTEATELWLD